MSFPAPPSPPHEPALDLVATALDPVLTPLGFAAAQGGASGSEGQVIFCRGVEGSVDDGCIDLVIELRATPEWHIADVRYWGFPAERWHLPFPREEDLRVQLAHLAGTLPGTLQ